jgi:hypothetical protein
MKIWTILIIICVSYCECHNKNDNNSYKDQQYLNVLCDDNSKFPIDSLTDLRSSSIQLNNGYLSIKQINKPSDTFTLRVLYYSEKQLRIFEFRYFNTESLIQIYSFPLGIRSTSPITFNKSKDDIKDFTQSIDSEKKVKL